MNLRLTALAGVSLAAMLVACGGSGATGNLPSGPTPTPSAPPTAGPGSSFAYTGTLNQSNTYAYPNPSPLPSTAASAQVTENVVVSASGAPPPLNVPASALDYKASEVDAYPLQSVSTTTDSWQASVAAGSVTQFLQYATNVSTNANAATASTIATSYTAPQILNESPETSGATWTNSNGGTVNETDADGTTDVTNRNADGTYTDTQKLANSTLNLTIAVNADGSGSYGGTALEQYAINGENIQEIQMLAPSGGKVTVQYLFVPPATPAPPATPPPSPAPLVIATPAVWFQGAPYADTTTVATGVNFPGSCAVPAQFGTSGASVTRKISSYDPVLGFTDAQTLVSYIGSAGPVCVTLADKQVTYYDYLNDTTAAFDNFADFEGTPQATQTISETLTLQSTTTASSLRHIASVTAVRAAALSPAGLAFATAQFEARVQQARAVRRKAALRSLIRFVHNHFGGSVR